MLLSAVRKFLSRSCSSADRENKLTRVNAGKDYAVCSACGKAIPPFSDYWKGKKNYCDKCRPEGVTLEVIVSDNLNVTSEPG